jgi:hypothetical protein
VETSYGQDPRTRPIRLSEISICCVSRSFVGTPYWPGWPYFVSKKGHPGGVAATTSYEAAKAASRLLDGNLAPGVYVPPSKPSRLKDGHSMICSRCLAGGWEESCSHPWDLMASGYHTGACAKCGHEVAGTEEDHLHCADGA